MILSLAIFAQTWRSALRGSVGEKFWAFLLASRHLAFESGHSFMLKSIIDWYMAELQTGGYFLIALLMAMESSIIPLPSEVVIPPVAHLAHSNQTRLTIYGIVIA